MRLFSDDYTYEYFMLRIVVVATLGGDEFPAVDVFWLMLWCDVCWVGVFFIKSQCFNIRRCTNPSRARQLLNYIPHKLPNSTMCNIKVLISKDCKTAFYIVDDYWWFLILLLMFRYPFFIRPKPTSVNIIHAIKPHWPF